MHRTSKVSLQIHQVLRLPRNSKFKISVRNPWITSANIKMFRAWSEDDPSMIRPWNRLTRPILEIYFVWNKFKISWSGYILKLHEILHLPRKISFQFPPNTVPGTKNILYFSLLYSLLAFFLSWHLFSLGIYFLLESILSWHLFSLGIYSLLAPILSWHLFALGIYFLLVSTLSWHLFSWHLFSFDIYFFDILNSKYLFSFGIYFLLASIFSMIIFFWHLFSKYF